MRVPESVPVRLAGFGIVLLAVFGASYSLGDAVGPVGPGASDSTDHSEMGDMSSSDHDGSTR